MISARVRNSGSLFAWYFSMIALTDSASMRACAGSYTPHGRSQCADTTVLGRNKLIWAPPIDPRVQVPQADPVVPAPSRAAAPPRGWADGRASSVLPFPPSWDPTQVPSFPPLTPWHGEQRIGRGRGRRARARWGPGVVRVAGSSMFPTLAAGDACLVWWSPRTRPRPGRVVVARLPRRPGVLAVKRVTGRRDGAWWLEGDNPVASTDSWQVGAVAGEDVLAWVLL